MTTPLIERWRGRRRDERGQAMPLAAVGIFAMVLGVLATLNLGQAVHEKIRLQNTADAAAYSLAAVEARTFNYIAFLNRVQIAHYNTAMVVQSYLTWVGFHMAVYGTTVDLLSTLRNALEMGTRVTTPCPKGPRCLYQALYNAINPIAMAAEQMRDALFQIHELVDLLGHQIVQAMSIFNNHAIWQSQFARAALVNSHTVSGGQSFISEMDPEVYTSNILLNMFVNGALNTLEYNSVWDPAAGLSPGLGGIMDNGGFSTPKKDPDNLTEEEQEAYRVMTELCHATRTPRFVSDRRAGVNPVMLPQAGMFNPFITGSKLGQTKFTEDDSLSNAEIRAIQSEGNYEVGKTLSSDDFLQRGQGTATSPLAMALYRGNNRLGDAIAAYNQGITHYLYTGPRSTTNNRISPGGRETQVIPGMVSPPGQTGTQEEKTHDRNRHGNWPGYAPFFKFKPVADRTRDFNQPSTWIFLNKHHRDFQTDAGSHAQNTRAPWYSNFEWTNGAHRQRLNTAIGSSRSSFLFQGITVISRGMAYYHRPGHWQEHPNFFNPFWRARLAPVGQKLQQFWDRYVTSNIQTDSQSSVVQGMVSFLRNAQMDLITGVITSIITH
jgi:hypothetical protein